MSLKREVQDFRAALDAGLWGHLEVFLDLHEFLGRSVAVLEHVCCYFFFGSPSSDQGLRAVFSSGLW